MSKFLFFSRWNIQTKFIISIAVVHLVLMSVFVVDLVRQQKVFLLQESITAALSQASLIASSSSSWVLADDLVGMEEVLQSSLQNSALVYALIADDQGLVLAHTDRSKIGKYLSDIDSLGAINHSSYPKLWKKNQDTIHVSSPVLITKRSIGWVLLGLDTTPTKKHLQYVTVHGLYYTLIAIFIGTVFAWYLARYILRQLKLLLEGVDRLSANELDQPIPIITYDEIGRVGRALNHAMESLQHSQSKIQQEISVRRRAEQDIRYLSQKLIDSSEEERKRIGHDLHDEMGQMITGFQFGLQSLALHLPTNPNQGLELCNKLAIQAEEMGEALGRVTSDLWPTTLEHFGLPTAILTYVKEFNCLLPALNISVNTINFINRLNPRLEIVCFRIIQEALTNVARHAKANAVEILLEIKEERLTMLIRDNGEGFENVIVESRYPDHKGIGLLGMRERANSMGGQLSIISTPGKGCTVLADLPVGIAE